MHPLVKLVRPVNVIMGFAAVIIGGWAFKEWVLLPELFAVGLAWAMFTAAANMINDALDVPIDRINHPERALPQGLLDPKVVLLCAFFLIMPALYLCAIINIYLLALVTGCLVLDYVYEKWLKKKGFIGNLAVGVLVGSGFVAGAIVTNNLPFGVFIGFLALLANSGREIVKDMEDEPGDLGRKSFVKTYGAGTARALAAVFFVSPVVLALMLYFPLRHGGWAYITFIMLSGAFFIISAYVAGKNPKLAQRGAKIGMVLALAGFVFGAL